MLNYCTYTLKCICYHLSSGNYKELFVRRDMEGQVVDMATVTLLL